MSVLIQILKSIVFGIVEGITEWLPISSTGHLILLNAVIPLTDNAEFWDMYKYIIQLGAILAVIVLYWHKLWPFSPKKNEKEKKDTWDIWVKIVIASIPTGIVGVLLNDYADAHLSTPVVVAVALIVYGVLFLVIERVPRKAKIKSIAAIDFKTAFLIGCAQSLAVIPGTSRSGSTILGALLLGLSRGTAAEFSFFLAIPVMFGVSLLELVKHAAAVSLGEVIVLIVGMVVSFVVSVMVIRSLMSYIRKHNFRAFGLYRIALGALILILALLGVLPAAISA
ncbi:MAG TPA: undecaprenyl-diphosphate phosphatase [Erysipelotrichaceae bacterium]|uniref:undecaprenyl-diphosphate phosphatase n=1 Tax=Galactobacillus timonensis TaxID=2041840 RepID=UPI000C8183C6|nr:undecaprenyl-diphosphate phosphatase [Galactobacillus timonensis]MCI6754946.1 undecaprenyl-diphosphate phosphatase [Galactobacillus timonensis]MDY6283005.1 undecaprenyl-diphosphate phosphatase [Erysipelotrichaceae bacterium]HCV54891.1 undecaprenyl-diphosphate phosphatase [Erysipelotrichaceae bacterium]HCW55124.1 undecaprenyl-diphosphate phosphatase [Erysipelotrichaceae bacterium]